MSSSSGASSKVRLPPRYAREAELAEARNATRAVDPEQVLRAFRVWDADDDGRITAADIGGFVKKMCLQPPTGGWEAYIGLMVQEAISRTGFVSGSGRPTADARQHLLTVEDVRAAVSFRLNPTNKAVIKRAHRDVWIALIRAAVPLAGEGQLWASPQFSSALFAPPAMTCRERDEVRLLTRSRSKGARPSTAQATLGGGGSVGSGSLLRGSASSLLTSPVSSGGLSRAVSWTGRPSTAPHLGSSASLGSTVSGGRRRRNRADGLQYPVPDFVDPHLGLATQLSRLSTTTLGGDEAVSLCAFQNRAQKQQLQRQMETFCGGTFDSDDDDAEATKPRRDRPASGPSARPEWDTRSRSGARSSGPAPHEDDEDRRAARGGKKRTKNSSKSFKSPSERHSVERALLALEQRLSTAHDLQRAASPSPLRRPPSRAQRAAEPAARAPFRLRGDDAESRLEQLVRLSHAGGARAMFGKSSQASFELSEPLPYRHCVRADDPVGLDRRSALVQTHISSSTPAFKVFAGASPIVRNTSQLGSDDTAGVNYVQLGRTGSMEYDHTAPHPRPRSYTLSA